MKPQQWVPAMNTGDDDIELILIDEYTVDIRTCSPPPPPTVNTVVFVSRDFLVTWTYKSPLLEPKQKDFLGFFQRLPHMIPLFNNFRPCLSS